MTSFELIVVIEVPEANKVLCQSEGCGRSVYKRVHVIKLDENIKVFGSECYKKLCKQHPELKKVKPVYSQSGGIKLTEEERELLINNTKELLTKFENDQQVETNKEALKTNKVIDKTDKELKKKALQITKDDFRNNKKLDPDLPGWKGWVNFEAEKLYKSLKAKKLTKL